MSSVRECDMRPSNYDIMLGRMEAEFAKSDHSEAIEKFGLKSDAEYIYIRFVGRDYRIGRSSGRVEWSSGSEYIHAGYNESMTIFDMLAYSKPDCRLDGTFVKSEDFCNRFSLPTPGAGIFSKQVKCFGGRCDALKDACLKLGGIPGTVGDVSSTIPLFDFFPVVVQFWDADDEFDAVIKFMWDKNATDFIHFETIAYAAGHLIERLKECME